MVEHSDSNHGQINPIHRVSAEDLSLPVEDFPQSGKDQNFTSGLTDFLRRLYEMPEVSGVAFSSFSTSFGPRLVCSAIIPPPNEVLSAGVFRGITQAHTQLHRTLSEMQVMTHLRFFHSDLGQSLEAVAENLNRAPNSTLLGIASFERQS